jgi:hypothetical protein
MFKRNGDQDKIPIINKFDIIVKALYNKDYMVDAMNNTRVRVHQHHRYFYYPKIRRALEIPKLKRKPNTRKSTNPSLYRAQIYDISAILFYIPSIKFFGIVPLDESYPIKPHDDSHDFFNQLLLNTDLSKAQQIGNNKIPVLIESIDIRQSKVLILDADLTSIYAFVGQQNKNKIYATTKSSLQNLQQDMITQLVKVHHGKVSWLNSLYLKNKTKEQQPKVHYKVIDVNDNFTWFKGKDPILRTILFLDVLYQNHKTQILESRLAKRRKYKKTFMRRIIDSLKVLEDTHSFEF